MTDSAQASSVRLPALVELVVDDAASAWENAGFCVERLNFDHVVQIGNITIRLTGGAGTGATANQSAPERSDNERSGVRHPGIREWTMAGLRDEWIQHQIGSDTDQPQSPSPKRRSLMLDGISTLTVPADRPPFNPPRVSDRVTNHANLVTHLDHVVITTKNMQRTIAAFEQAGFVLRRIRDIAPNQQAFFWAGETILEIVGPVKPHETSGAAQLWGLAMTSQDLHAAGEHLGAGLGQVKSAVQKGREIATLRGKDIGVTVPIVLMSAHRTEEEERSEDEQPDPRT